jgi:hypothetical protein
MHSHTKVYYQMIKIRILHTVPDMLQHLGHILLLTKLLIPMCQNNFAVFKEYFLSTLKIHFTDTSASTRTRLRAGEQEDHNSPFPNASRQALRSTQSQFNEYQSFFPPRVKLSRSEADRFTSRLMQRLRITKPIPPFPHIP